ncbi:hypothetical protein [Segatella paludivivens]|uniref:hypothetical protein n=1 Tax=Segatella paludivivens TaxID=185294 RepID=UPI00037B8935|nr:hypothetical protein [Segatella paludivivens]
MTQKDTEQLIKKYLNGETSLEEEKLLAREVSRDNAPQEWKIITEMIGDLAVDETVYDEMVTKRKTSRTFKIWPWLGAACVAALMVVVFTPPRNENTLAKNGNKNSNVTIKNIVEEAPITPSEKSKLVETKTEKQVRTRMVAAKVQKRTTKKQIIKTTADSPAEPQVESASVEIVKTVDPVELYKKEFLAHTNAIKERGKRVTKDVANANNEMNALQNKLFN